MAENIVTPLQLWQGFNPVREPLDISFVGSTETADGIITMGCYFTSETKEDGRVRAFATIYYSGANRDNPTLLFIPDYHTESVDFSILEATIKSGYNVVSIDYSGEKKSVTDYTRYPASLDYCNIVRSGEHLYSAIPSARETCVFQWSKVVRRCISLIQSISFLNDRIALIGVKEGANMMWQVGGMDSRVNTVVPIINAGWNNDTDKLGEEGYEIDDERERWIAACTAEAYAKFINCPLLFLGATNSTITSFDRVRDTFALLPQEIEKSMVIAADSANQIQRTGLTTLEKWMDHVFGGAKFPQHPELSYEIKDGRLHVNIVSDTTMDIAEVMLLYAYGDSNSEFRFWNKKNLSVDFTGRSYGEVEVYDQDEPIILFANIYYKNGSAISSNTVSIDLKDADIEEEKYRQARILFERKNGVNNFVIENEGFVADKSNLKMEAGPYNIQGVCVDKGYISTYIVGDKRYRGREGTLLQLDVYSKEARVIDIVLYTEEDNKTYQYTAKVELSGGEIWQKITLPSQEFKDSGRHSLINWDNIKKLTIKNSEKVIISNMIWV